MKDFLPPTVEDLFENKNTTYTFNSKDSMDNFWSMNWFIKRLDLSEFITVHDGTQIFLKHPLFDYEIQIDAGGLGDFYSHKFDVRIVD